MQETPLYLVRLLLEEMDGIDALDQQRGALLSMLPHMDRDDRAEALRKLTRRSDALWEMGEPVLPLVHDPIAAAAWFAEHGIRTTED